MKKEERDALVEAVCRMAKTGEGTDDCLAKGCLPLPVHFYSPVPDIADLKRRGVFGRRSPLAGVDFRPAAQVALLRELGAAHGQECDWPRDPTGDPFAFHTHNGCFSYGCAAALHCMVRANKPRRVVEVGSGNSTLVLAAALRANAADTGVICDYSVIDPFMRPAFADQELAEISQALRQPVETVPPDFFQELAAGDILFVDSSHTVRTGGDVNHLVLDVLPLLAPGVVVHFHDIHLPFEYHEVYFTNPGFRVFWTEAYLLQAFLACNREFEVLLGMAWLMAERKEDFRAAFPCFDPAANWSDSGSFWIRRRPAQ